jgi:hypothetical protein
VRGASNPSTEKELKLKKLNVQINQDGLNGIDDGEDNGIRTPNLILAPGSKGRPKQRWKDNIIQDIRQLNIKNWTVCVQDRTKWKNVVEKAKTFNKRR